MKKIKKLFSFWLPPVLWASLIFYLSSRSLPPTSEIYWKDFIVKKSAHIIEFGIFSTLLYRAFRSSGLNKKNSGIFALALAIIYASTDEYHQSMIPGREPRVRDVVFDTIGASLAIYLIWNLLPKAQGKLKNLVKKLQLI
ncbi:VanZ family protein [Patescibacteria group bacterium]